MTCGRYSMCRACRGLSSGIGPVIARSVLLLWTPTGRRVTERDGSVARIPCLVFRCYGICVLIYGGTTGARLGPPALIEANRARELRHGRGKSVMQLALEGLHLSSTALLSRFEPCASMTCRVSVLSSASRCCNVRAVDLDARWHRC